MKKYFENVVRSIDRENAEYILKDPEIMSMFDTVSRLSGNGQIKLAVYHFRKVKKKIAEFAKTRLTPSTVSVGMGVTINLWSDRHAATVTGVTKSTVTVRRDKATIDPEFTPEFVVGGFACHCTNQMDQSYTYEPDRNGEVETFRWAPKYNRYGKGGSPWLSRGRHEFYDYNF